MSHYKSEIYEHWGAIKWDLKGPILSYGQTQHNWCILPQHADEFIKMMEDALENIRKLKEKMENEKDDN